MHRLVRDRVQFHDLIDAAVQVGHRTPGELQVLHRAGLVRDVQKAQRPVLPVGLLIGGEAGAVEAVDHDRHIGPVGVHERFCGQNVDDATVEPVAAVQRIGLDRQRQRHRHANSHGGHQVRVRVRAQVLQAIALDVPDWKPHRVGELAQCHVPQHRPVGGLEPVAAQKSRPPAHQFPRCCESACPVRVDVVARHETQRRLCHLLGRHSRGQRHSEEGRARTHPVARRLDPRLVQNLGGPDH